MTEMSRAAYMAKLGAILESNMSRVQREFAARVIQRAWRRYRARQQAGAESFKPSASQRIAYLEAEVEASLEENASWRRNSMRTYSRQPTRTASRLSRQTTRTGSACAFYGPSSRPASRAALHSRQGGQLVAQGSFGDALGSTVLVSLSGMGSSLHASVSGVGFGARGQSMGAGAGKGLDDTGAVAGKGLDDMALGVDELADGNEVSSSRGLYDGRSMVDRPHSSKPPKRPGRHVSMANSARSSGDSEPIDRGSRPASSCSSRAAGPGVLSAGGSRKDGDAKDDQAEEMMVQEDLVSVLMERASQRAYPQGFAKVSDMLAAASANASATRVWRKQAQRARSGKAGLAALVPADTSPAIAAAAEPEAGESGKPACQQPLFRAKSMFRRSSAAAPEAADRAPVRPAGRSAARLSNPPATALPPVPIPAGDAGRDDTEDEDDWGLPPPPEEGSPDLLSSLLPAGVDSVLIQQPGRAQRVVRGLARLHAKPPPRLPLTQARRDKKAEPRRSSFGVDPILAAPETQQMSMPPPSSPGSPQPALDAEGSAPFAASSVLGVRSPRGHHQGRRRPLRAGALHSPAGGGWFGPEVVGITAGVQAQMLGGSLEAASAPWGVLHHRQLDHDVDGAEFSALMPGLPAATGFEEPTNEVWEGDLSLGMKKRHEKGIGRHQTGHLWGSNVDFAPEQGAFSFVVGGHGLGGARTADQGAQDPNRVPPRASVGVRVRPPDARSRSRVRSMLALMLEARVINIARLHEGQQQQAAAAISELHRVQEGAVQEAPAPLPVAPVPLPVEAETWDAPRSFYRGLSRRRRRPTTREWLVYHAYVQKAAARAAKERRASDDSPLADSNPLLRLALNQEAIIALRPRARAEQTAKAVAAAVAHSRQQYEQALLQGSGYRTAAVASDFSSLDQQIASIRSSLGLVSGGTSASSGLVAALQVMGQICRPRVRAPVAHQHNARGPHEAEAAAPSPTSQGLQSTFRLQSGAAGAVIQAGAAVAAAASAVFSVISGQHEWHPTQAMAAQVTAGWQHSGKVHRAPAWRLRQQRRAPSWEAAHIPSLPVAVAPPSPRPPPRFERAVEKPAAGSSDSVDPGGRGSFMHARKLDKIKLNLLPPLTLSSQPNAAGSPTSVLASLPDAGMQGPASPISSPLRPVIGSHATLPATGGLRDPPAALSSSFLQAILSPHKHDLQPPSPSRLIHVGDAGTAQGPLWPAFSTPRDAVAATKEPALLPVGAAVWKAPKEAAILPVGAGVWKPRERGRRGPAGGVLLVGAPRPPGAVASSALGSKAGLFVPSGSRLFEGWLLRSAGKDGPDAAELQVAANASLPLKRLQPLPHPPAASQRL